MDTETNDRKEERKKRIVNSIKAVDGSDFYE